MKKFVLSLALVSASASGVERGFISSHNHYRALEGFEEIWWSTKLQKSAEKSAKKCLGKRSNTRYGEKFAMIRGAKPPISQIVHGWVPSTIYRNFYQSSYIGCAVNRCGSANNYVCHYFPSAWGDE